MSSGLPNLPSDIAGLFSAAVSLLTGDAVGLGANTPQWGIFLDGEPVIVADSVIAFEYSQDFHISDYPIEQGAFASYNKVQRPGEVKFRFGTGGSLTDRQAFLQSINAVISDTNLYDIVTPEITYSNFNLTHQDYRRTGQSGAGLLTVDVWAEEVRPAQLATSTITTNATGNTTTTNPQAGTPNATVASDFSDINQPQNPTASPQVNGGNVQPQAPTAAQQSAADSVLAQSMLPF
jgi:hypothetical protein